MKKCWQALPSKPAGDHPIQPLLGDLLLPVTQKTHYSTNRIPPIHMYARNSSILSLFAYYIILFLFLSITALYFQKKFLLRNYTLKNLPTYFIVQL